MGVVQNALSAGTSNLITHGAKIEKKKKTVLNQTELAFIFS